MKHITATHSHLKFFACAEVDCLRRFPSENAFKKHRRALHSGGQNKPVLATAGSNISQNPHSEDGSEPHESTYDFNPDDESVNMHDDRDNNRGSIDEPSNDVGAKASRALKFIAKLHSYSDLNRKRVVDIIQDVSQFFESEVESFLNIFQKYSRKFEVHEQEEINVELTKLKNPFKNLDTLHLQLQRLQSSGCYICPQQIILGERDDYRKMNGEMRLIRVKTTAELVSLPRVFQKFFQMPGIYQKVLNYVEDLSRRNTISNFIQGQYWQSRLSTFGEKIVFPMFMYHDDYENNNPLGSHAGIAKCGAVYASIPCLPPEMSSKLSNYFLFSLFNSLDRKLLSNEIVFMDAVNQMKELKEVGILINVNGKKIRIYFELALILGDNLGKHSIEGFVECFRANHPCIMCSAHISNFRSMFVEDKVFLRTRENYLEQLAQGNIGIKEMSVFHALYWYHVTVNIHVDVMHDILQGVFCFDTLKVLAVFIIEKKYFNIQFFHRRVNAFPYKKNENKPCLDITESFLKNDGKLKMSASECLTLARNLPLLIGDRVPVDDEHWKLLVLLNKILAIIICDSFVSGTENYLELLIKEYLELLEYLFPGSIKPKHHHMIHYPSVMRMMGPLWKISSMRYESKNKEGKVTSHAAICRINICRTIAVKHQLKLAYRFICENLDEPLIWEFGGSSITTLNLLESYCKFSHVFPYTRDCELKTVKWVTYFNRKICPGDVLVFFNNEANDTDLEPKFYGIHVLVIVEEILLIVAKILPGLLFDSHFQCYEVDLEENEFTEWVCLDKKFVQKYFISSSYLISEKRSFITNFSF
jgi:hypothetical protein